MVVEVVVEEVEEGGGASTCVSQSLEGLKTPIHRDNTDGALGKYDYYS